MATHADVPGWGGRRLLSGDWNGLVPDRLDVLRYAFIAGTIVFAAQGRSAAVALGAAGAGVLLARGGGVWRGAGGARLLARGGRALPAGAKWGGGGAGRLGWGAGPAPPHHGARPSAPAHERCHAPRG